MNWDTIQLGDVIDIKHGYAFKSEFFSDLGEFILLSPGNCEISGGLKLKGEKEKYYVGEFPPEYLLNEGDMLVVMTDLINTAPILGGSFVIPENNRFLHNQRLGLVRITDEQRIDKSFLYYLLNTYNYRAQVRGSASGATVRHTAPDRIKECKVRIPRDVIYQREIGKTLSAYDDLIENNRRRIALLEEAARLLYQEWFVHLRFPGHEHITDDIPEGWTKGVVADFYDTGSGGTPSRKNSEYFVGEIPWVKTQELPNGFIIETQECISEEGLKNSSARFFPSRTVLVALYGATVGEVGILAMEAATNQACCALLPKDSRAHYTYAFLFFRENKEKLMNLSAGAAQNNISQQIIRGYEMLMPSTTLMDAFVEIINPFFDQWLNLLRQNQKLRAARDLLLPRLMSGEIEV